MTDATIPDETALTAAAEPWQNFSRSAAETAPVLSVEGFLGPLDWLLEMALARKIDLAKLSIVALVEAFAIALQGALEPAGGRPVPLGRLGEWLIMAATLAELRSRLLLPADAPQTRAAAQEAETLRRQLVGRAQMRAAADWLERRTQLGREVFARGRPEASTAGSGGDIADLLRACLAALRVPEPPAVHRARPILWTVTEALARLRSLLEAAPEGSALAAYLPKVEEGVGRALRARAALASTLLAGLELARTGELHLHQAEAWAPIQVHANTVA